ncbi:MAG: rhamnogalacturonan acetylesterase [Rikenellaceae bacterium]|nr:rhamnogalacturonan acetylesterase [Rikenellaceae bacterium]
MEDVNKVVDNTFDSINKARTARPVSGSTRVGDNPVLFLVGNSTMRTGTLGNGSNGQWGWGYFAPDFFDPEKITVENHALGGMSTRTFYNHLWAEVLEGVKPGDWVIIELGHNDNGPYDSGRARATIRGIDKDSLVVTIQETGQQETVYSYGEYMRKYIDEVRAKGAYPILMSLTPRNSWEEDGTITRVDKTFGLWAKQVAEEKGVPFIDLNEITARKYEKFGPEKVDYMFYLDKIHTSAFGAKVNAESAVEGIRNYPGLELADYLLPEKIPYDSPARVGDNPVIFTVGDSTVKNADNDEDGPFSWGSVIGRFFDDGKITVDNQAMAGRSTRTFLDEGRWDKVYEALRPGDYVLIQFGHNEGGEINTGKARGVFKGSGDDSKVLLMESTGKYQVIYTFGWYLRKFIMDVQEKEAVPVILSHIPRNQWTEEGKVIRNSSSYGLWAKEAAEATGACFIDLNEISAVKLENMGREAAAEYFKGDHTHTSFKGALLNAESIVEGIKDSDCGLKNYLK